MNGILEKINSTLAWKGYKKELNPHIEELNRIANKAGRRERVTEKEIDFVNEVNRIINFGE